MLLSAHMRTYHYTSDGLLISYGLFLFLQDLLDALRMSYSYPGGTRSVFWKYWTTILIKSNTILQIFHEYFNDILEIAAALSIHILLAFHWRSNAIQTEGG